ncbi:Uncharacterised protein [Mycobacterium tuberculosis]|nr:Uncharacterised protein [Mycobacterium tuberculosis]
MPLERFQMITAATTSSSTDTTRKATTKAPIARSGSMPVLPSCAALMQNSTTGSGKLSQRISVWQAW